jgi:hypothetical protein
MIVVGIVAVGMVVGLSGCVASVMATVGLAAALPARPAALSARSAPAAAFVAAARIRMVGIVMAARRAAVDVATAMILGAGGTGEGGHAHCQRERQRCPRQSRAYGETP